VAGLIAITIWNSVHKSLWIDEAYSFHSANRAVLTTWHQAIHFETQPPLYFVLLNLWLRLGSPSVHWMRTLSALAAIGCMAFLWATRPANLGRRGVPAPVFAMVTATVVWAAAEARPCSSQRGRRTSSSASWTGRTIAHGLTRRCTRSGPTPG
jgi:uncharacterized membrane protein